MFNQGQDGRIFGVSLPPSPSRSQPLPTISRRRYDGYVDQWLRQRRLRNVFPSRLVPRLVALYYVLQGFDRDAEYSEHDVNQRIKERNCFRIDHVHLRRYLIDYLMLGRTRDGARYKMSRGYLSLARWDPELPGTSLAWD